MILVSACLLGKNVKYNGGNNLCWLAKYIDHPKVAAICPETFGNLKAPRPPAEIIDGSGEDVLQGNAKVQNKNGLDITEEFIDGARQALKIAQEQNAYAAILKARSPSCGVDLIYDGTFTGTTKQGNGVAATLLKQHNIKLYTEETITEEEFLRLLES